MDVRRRPDKPLPTAKSVTGGEPLKSQHQHPKASDALPLPLYLINGFFFTMFFSVMYFLLHRWREKIQNSTPLHLVTLSELAALVLLTASVIYLIGFFGIGFVRSVIRPSPKGWDILEDDPQGYRVFSPSQSQDCPHASIKAEACRCDGRATCT